VALVACAWLVTGCHKQRQQVYQPTAPSLGEEPPPVVARHKAPTIESAPADAAGMIPPDAVHGPPASTETGLASWYGPPYSGRKGADGSVYDQNAMTAASLTLPLGTVARVTNLTNNHAVLVKITDRGPFVRGRISRWQRPRLRACIAQAWPRFR
jgi:rare lipoprotein A